MIFAFIAVSAAYWALRLLDRRTTREALATGDYVEHPAMANPDGTLDERKFWLRAAMWQGVFLALYLVAVFVNPALHGAWLAVAGVLLARSVMASARNRRAAGGAK